jgi:hypothetical protein
MVIDHLGNNFASIKEMCAFHKCPYGTYKRRYAENKEWPVEWLLYGKLDIVDHLGNKFATVNKMCAFHNVHHSTYQKRQLEHPDWSPAELLAPSEKQYRTIDPESLSHADSIGLERHIIYSRLDDGWTLDEAVGKSGRGLARRINDGYQPSAKIQVTDYYHKSRFYKSTGYKISSLVDTGTRLHKTSYFIAKIKESGKYSIMNADEILAFDGTTLELIFDAYIW